MLSVPVDDALTELDRARCWVVLDVQVAEVGRRVLLGSDGEQVVAVASTGGGSTATAERFDLADWPRRCRSWVPQARPPGGHRERFECSAEDLALALAGVPDNRPLPGAGERLVCGCRGRLRATAVNRDTGRHATLAAVLGPDDWWTLAPGRHGRIRFTRGQVLGPWGALVWRGALA